jgi:hypothetical protein
MPTAQADLARLTAALDQAGAAGLTQTQIYSDVFGRHRSTAQIDSLLTQLQTAEAASWERIDPAGGRDRPTIRWKANAHSDIFSTNGGGVPAENVEGPPPGDGWLPLRETRFRAAYGVMPAHAARVGKRLWRDSARGRKNPDGDPLRPEYRGGRHLAEIAFRSYLSSGVIEVRGDWVRLARNPPSRPRHHWYEAWLMILAAAHPTLDGKWHPKPKRTVRLVKETALGRQLEPDEYVRRQPGKAGSWDPADIDVITKLRPDIWTAEGVRRLADTLADREHH